MALQAMTDARNVMMDARRKPAVWLMSPSAYKELQAEQVLMRQTLMFLPIRIVEQWSFGWLLLDELRANAMGITDLE